MGRLARKRKIKAVDPFSRRQSEITKQLREGKDVAPKADDMDLIQAPGQVATTGRESSKPRKRSRSPSADPGPETRNDADETSHNQRETKGEPRAKRPAMPQLERLPSESLRVFRGRLREAARRAIQETKTGSLRHVSKTRRDYLATRSERRLEKKEGRAVALLTRRPDAHVPLAARLELPKDVAIERAVLQRRDAVFGEQVKAPPELQVSNKLARRALAHGRTRTMAESLLLGAHATVAAHRHPDGHPHHQDDDDDDNDDDDGDDDGGAARAAGHGHGTKGWIGRKTEVASGATGSSSGDVRSTVLREYARMRDRKSHLRPASSAGAVLPRSASMEFSC